MNMNDTEMTPEQLSGAPVSPQADDPAAAAAPAPETGYAAASSPKPPRAPKPRKKLTREQRWWRFHGLQAGLFMSFGIVASLILIALICLITLPFRGALNQSPEAPAASAAPESQQEDSLLEAEPTPTPTPEVHTVNLMAVGDNLIHSTVYEFAEQDDGTYDFTDIYKYIADDIGQADLACIQQETILVSDPANYSNYPSFGTPDAMADSLTAVGFNVVCQASNHTTDMGETGISDTLAAWAKHPEVTVLGLHGSQEDADTIRVVEKNGIKIALLDYTYGLNGALPENDYEIDLMDEDHKDLIESQLEQAKTMADITVVFMHDGTEDSFVPDEDQKTWAQLFADHGVGLVIGTHPHVAEPVDVITGKDGNKMPIFYSLGNCVSSQRDTFNMLGGMAKATITKDETGTYVSQYNITPLVNLIQSGGTHGLGYQFHVLHMDDYTDELAATHIRENCSRADIQAVWDEIFADASTGTDDPKHPLSAGTPAENTAAASTETSPAVSPDPNAAVGEPDASAAEASPAGSPAAEITVISPAEASPSPSAA